MERKLAAILSADVKGYSILMANDEKATIQTLIVYRGVMTTLIQQHHGRVVDSPGDNLLAEFASAVDAVKAAVEIQEELTTKNADLPSHRQMHYRIGLNVGDVIIEGERIYGDGVNIAARLERLADAGGIAISGTIYDQVKNKLDFAYPPQGEQMVRNIAEPVRVYTVLFGPEADRQSRFRLSQSQPQGPISMALRGDKQRLFWLSHLSLKRSMALVLAPLTMIVAATYWSSALAPLFSETTLPSVQGSPRVPDAEPSSTLSTADPHRSFETALSPGQQSVPIMDERGRQVGTYIESHALVVGISHYTGGWTPLPGVLVDVRAVTQALEKQGFHVVVVLDPNVAELEAAYRDFIGKYGLSPDNRLLFYYAGSAYTVKPAYALNDQKDWVGYLVARDTPLPIADPAGFRRLALSMERFASMAREIEAKHALFIFDACFAGSVAFALSRSPVANIEITYQTNEPVRQFITSGAADQEVPDRSLFRQFFVSALAGNPEADRNGDGYLTGSELGAFLQEKVTLASQGTSSPHTPQYGKMTDIHFNKGEFVFTLPYFVSSPSVVTLPTNP